ncbi:MAG TPA: ABC transporter permease [Bryobacteraceae bacterium]|jgi:phospholipid/cholesterol/gamma-HCH transport system permease protein|nr:ABC transporter permease [Bryobacteraceae bacterium]
MPARSEAASNPVNSFLVRLGGATEGVFVYLGGLAELTARSLLLVVASPLKRGRSLQRAVHQAMASGVTAIPIVSLITFFIGLIMALQGAYELKKLGAMQMVPALVAVSVTRELGPLITAIVVIGRSGSAFAAEIGTMRVTEELDALSTMALDPLAFLVAPKFVAMAVMVPCLAVWSDFMGVLGGCLFGVTGGGFSAVGYFVSTRNALVLSDVMTGVVKSLVFGIIITAVGCHEGFATGAGAEEVGKSTTSAVVISILMVILVDVVFTALFYLTGGLT